MIHRDHRKHFESASSFGQIMHRRGPRETTCGDIDLYLDHRIGNAALFRIIERFQAVSPLKDRQRHALQLLDQIIRHAVMCPLFTDRLLFDGSGVWILRGDIMGGNEGRREVDFCGPQTVQRFDGSETFNPCDGEELFSWLIGTANWRRYDGKPRELRSREDRIALDKKVAPHTPKKVAVDAVMKLLPRLTKEERLKVQYVLNRLLGIAA